MTRLSRVEPAISVTDPRGAYYSAQEVQRVRYLDMGICSNEKEPEGKLAGYLIMRFFFFFFKAVRQPFPNSYSCDEHFILSTLACSLGQNHAWPSIVFTGLLLATVGYIVVLRACILMRACMALLAETRRSQWVTLHS